MGSGKSKAKGPQDSGTHSTPNRGQGSSKAVENAAAGAVPPDSGAKSSLRSSPAPAGREAADTALLFDAFRQVCARCLREICCGAPLRMSAWA